MNTTFSSTETVSPVLVTFIDALGVMRKGVMAPYREKSKGTLGDGKDPRRVLIISDWAMRDLLPTLLEATGHSGKAIKLRSLPDATVNESALWQAFEPLRDLAVAVHRPNSIEGDNVYNTVNNALEALWVLQQGKYAMAVARMGFMSRTSKSAVIAHGETSPDEVQGSIVRVLNKLMSA